MRNMQSLVDSLNQTADVYGAEKAIEMLRTAFYHNAENLANGHDVTVGSARLHDSECMFAMLIDTIRRFGA